ncbi:MAG TPA: translation initiation factor IF-6 [Candidatus Korarchaeota archaeon]|nr:MAG: translation initiation factor IF-6 [Candidatus Korarchaeota archaeon]HDD68804.1 translation initiation factor IF-6 [Candidatus Korarchaeota archaeon]
MVSHLPVLKAKFQGNENIGVFVKAVGDLVFIPKRSPPSFKEKVMECFGSYPIEIQIYQSDLLGIFLAGNESGLLVPHLIMPDEFESLQRNSKIPLYPLDFTINAFGNAILVNDYGALVSPWFNEEETRKIGELLKVKVKRGTIAGFPVPGSVAVVTNKGGIVTPQTSNEEIKALRELFEVDFLRGTVNRGIKYLKLGIVANDKGALVGELTTPWELETIIEAFGLE